ncbi:hypothetical protein DRO59_02185 [Candidatus Bathyarchaeota archaeon]|nr:MAG: hypothetical protein DRO59_02185 [Candidatus Bathyarchaeota archaeon]
MIRLLLLILTGFFLVVPMHLCPECGSLLEPRKTKSGGVFWVCPHCGYEVIHPN